MLSVFCDIVSLMVPGETAGGEVIKPCSVKKASWKLDFISYTLLTLAGYCCFPIRRVRSSNIC